MKRDYEIGERSGMLTVLQVGLVKDKRSALLVKCDCGTEKVIVKRCLYREKTRSCGCAVFHPRVRNYTGKKFGMLTVVGFHELRGTHNYYRCKCECGNLISLISTAVKEGNNKSCGCKHPNLIHGQARKNQKSDAYSTWAEMVRRNKRPENITYISKGIAVCERWSHSFENFFADMGPRPSKRHSIDRIDNDGDYTPENCKWSTIEEQANNRSNNRIMVINGERMTMAQACRRFSMKYSTVSCRVARGWDDEDAIFGRSA